MLSEEPPMEAEVSEYEKFQKSDVKARMVIVQSVADNILEMLKDKKTARDIMHTLTQTYAKTGISTQVMLQKKLRSLKYNN